MQKIDDFPVKTIADIEVKLSFYTDLLRQAGNMTVSVESISEKIKRLFAIYKELEK